MSKNKRILSVLGFNAVTSFGGGIGLMTGWVAPPVDWLKHSWFANYLIPGAILFFVVGGSAALALYMLYASKRFRRSVLVLSGIIMMIWIVGEIISIRTFNWLQAVYIVTALAVIIEGTFMMSGSTYITRERWDE